MKTSNYIVRIPEPCHEDWNKMQPDDKGKFCGSCCKSVHDFSNKTDAEIRDILLENKGKDICGHFKKTQVNRPLNFSVNFNELPKNMSTTKAFAVALFLAFGTMLFSCTAVNGKKIDTIEVMNTNEGNVTETTPPDSLLFMKGQTVVSGNIVCKEETVDGGIRFEEVPVKDPQPIPDSLFFKEEVMGLMVIDPEPLDTVVTEPVPDTFKKLNEEVIEKKETEFVVFPNPTSGELIIKYDVAKRADVRVDILDLKGALIKTVVNINGQFEGKYQIPVNLNELPNGIYMVNLLNDGKKFTQKVVIEN